MSGKRCEGCLGLLGRGVGSVMLAVALAGANAVSAFAVGGPGEVPAGVTQEQPFRSGETAGSDHFRIPALTTLGNGWVLAASDARWGSTADSPHNIDGLVVLSKDGGATWEWSLQNHFVDYPDENAARQTDSASFIDPAIVQDSKGTIYMVSDAFPADAGLNGHNVGRESNGYDEGGNVIISKGTPGHSASRSVSSYGHIIDASKSRSFSLGDAQVELSPITPKDGGEAEAWVDCEFNLYSVSGDDATPQMTRQNHSDKQIQNNVFYRQSEYKVYPTCFIWLRTGTVSSEGIEWGAARTLPLKRGTEAFLGTCPGRGLIVPLPGGGERILFEFYTHQVPSQVERAQSVYSDDGGATWHRGNPTEEGIQAVSKTSESQSILLPNGDVRMYSRNGIGQISYADSSDQGASWGPQMIDPNLRYVGNCMVSFVNLDGALIAPDGTVRRNLVMASYPRGRGGQRQDGVIRIGSIDEKTNVVSWLNPDAVYHQGNYSYSCLTQIAPNKVGLLYEGFSSLGDIGYDSFGLTDVMGQGWKFATSVPEMTLSKPETEIGVGDKVTLSSTIRGADGVKIGWELKGEAENLDDIAAIDLATTDSGQEVTLEAKGYGAVTLVASAQVDVEGGSIRLSDSVTFYISDGSNVFLPDRFRNEETQKREGWVLQTGEIVEGDYIIFDPEFNGRIFYNFAYNNGKTDQLGGATDGTLLVPNPNTGSFPLHKQTWHLTPHESGFAIQGHASAGTLAEEYVNIAGATPKGLPVSGTPQAFSFERQDGGGFAVSASAGGTTYYLGLRNYHGRPYFSAGSDVIGRIQLYKEGAIFRVDASGSQALLSEIFDTERGEAVQERWDGLQAAKEGLLQAIEAALVDFPEEGTAGRARETLAQATQDAYCAIRDLRKPYYADYSAVAAAEAKLPPEGLRSRLTEESAQRLQEALSQIVRDLPYEEQAKVDAWAAALEEAIAGLRFNYLMLEAPSDLAAGERASFRSEADFALFESVELDGTTVDPALYAASEGSTLVSLRPTLTRSLDAGSHTLVIRSANGSATAEFNVRPAGGAGATPGTTPGSSDQNSGASEGVQSANSQVAAGGRSRKLPATGDALGMAAMAPLALGTLSGVMGILLGRRMR